MPAVLALALVLGLATPCLAQRDVVPVRLEPRREYVVYRAPAPPRIDGRLDDPAWAAAPWTADFVDIEGSARPAPALRTRAKLLWDDRALYVAAELEEPDVWGTLTRRDAVVFHDDDFELFLDPGGETQPYIEFEGNALGTAWDLLLTAPYRDGGIPLDSWDIKGLEYAVQVDGTLNRPGDHDRAWTVELALPWESLREVSPGHRPPAPGDTWRLNFSRVEWDVDVRDGRYVKRTGADGRPLPEHNWVWSPQGAVNMHMPERWGFVQFAATTAGQGTQAFSPDPDQPLADALRDLYYGERRIRAAEGRYTADLARLGPPATVAGHPFRPRLQAIDDAYDIEVAGTRGVLHIRQDGRSWTTAAGRAPAP